jgi:ribosomal protein S18 acetylase RimI-like enzyme
MMSSESVSPSQPARELLQIRRFESRDAAAVWELHRASIAATGADAGDDFYADLRDIAGEYLGKGGDFLLGFADGQLAAGGGYVPLSSDEVEIKRMRVHPSHQRKGFGEVLLSALEKGPAERGFRWVYLETTTLQQPALALYAKYGYRETGRGEKLGYTIVCLRKGLYFVTQT